MTTRDLPVPKSLTRYNFISLGSIGWVHRLPDGIALKYGLRGVMEEFINENETYDRLERHEAPATIMQSFLRLPGLNFMPLMAQSLAERIHANQDRDWPARRCIKVRRLEPAHKIGQWAAELAEAIAWLASIGLVHGDLRPSNLLLDQHDHLKLSDFDRIASIGSVHPGINSPWGRMHGCSNCHVLCPSVYGHYDALSEQFAFGSILYNLVTGVELYEDKGADAIDLLRDLKFPPMGDTPLERLTVKCWMGEFASLADLAQETANLEGAEAAANGTKFDAEYLNKAKARCQRILEEDLTDIAPHADAGEACEWQRLRRSASLGKP